MFWTVPAMLCLLWSLYKYMFMDMENGIHIGQGLSFGLPQFVLVWMGEICIVWMFCLVHVQVWFVSFAGLPRVGHLATCRLLLLQFWTCNKPSLKL